MIFLFSYKLVSSESFFKVHLCNQDWRFRWCSGPQRRISLSFFLPRYSLSSVSIYLAPPVFLSPVSAVRSAANPSLIILPVRLQLMLSKAANNPHTVPVQSFLNRAPHHPTSHTHTHTHTHKHTHIVAQHTSLSLRRTPPLKYSSVSPVRITPRFHHQWTFFTFALQVRCSDFLFLYNAVV